MDTYTVIGGQFVNAADNMSAEKRFYVTLENEIGKRHEIILSGNSLNTVKLGKEYFIEDDHSLRRVIRVAAAVICRDGKVFASQRGYGELKDHWEFPGGKVEKGETPEEALIREINEELATTIRVEKHLTRIEYDYPEFHLIMDCYICSVINGELTLIEHESSAWLSAGDLYTVDWLPADLLALSYVQNLLLNS